MKPIQINSGNDYFDHFFDHEAALLAGIQCLDAVSRDLTEDGNEDMAGALRGVRNTVFETVYLLRGVYNHLCELKEQDPDQEESGGLVITLT